MTGYLLLTKGEASFARKGAWVIIRASQVSYRNRSKAGGLQNIPADLVEEKVLVWFFNALETYIQRVRRSVQHIRARFSRALLGAPINLLRGQQ